MRAVLVATMLAVASYAAAQATTVLPQPAAQTAAGIAVQQQLAQQTYYLQLLAEQALEQQARGTELADPNALYLPEQ